MLEYKDKKVIIENGKRIFVRLEDKKHRGHFTIVNDSTIGIGENEIALSEIEMIAKPKAGKTVGMIFAAVPSSLFGFAIMAMGSGYGSTGSAIGGFTIMAGGIGVATSEIIRGKRYRSLKMGKKNKANNVRAWNYSVQIN